MSTADEIKKLNDLLRDGVLSQEEFDKQKDKLLNSNSIPHHNRIGLLLCYYVFL